MNLVHYASTFSTVRLFNQQRHSSSRTRRQRFIVTRSSVLPFSIKEAKYYKELEAAVDVVERACKFCVDVQTTLSSSEGKIIEKLDQSPVTVANFGVQALISLELGKLFPSIPLVAEEDSAFIRANNLVGPVVSVVTENTRFDGLTQSEVLEAIDRGGKDGATFGPKPSTYWLLDPIDDTRGFVQGEGALYVVGLALVVDDEIVLGVMGCSNYREDIFDSSSETTGNKKLPSGIIMVAHKGYGTWKRQILNTNDSAKPSETWTKCSVDECSTVQKARFCLSDSQPWEAIPLSASYNATFDIDNVGDKDILILPRTFTCCGSLSKYLMVAAGKASVFILRQKPQTIIKAWDHAVGELCVNEAGGKVTDWSGSEIDYVEDKALRRDVFPSVGFLVTNGSVHDQILGMISSQVPV